jgi:protein gp37
MGADSKIQWTDHTFNPWWGCARVSPGCENCYAEAFAKRTGKAKWGVKEERRFFGDKHWAEPLKWNAAARKAGERHRVFCASMADVFEDRDDLEDARFRLLALINQTPFLDWLLLTKRPENILRMLPGYFDAGAVPNIWFGTTVEDQRRAEERIPELLRVPAVVRFLSCEPLLGEVHLNLPRCETHDREFVSDEGDSCNECAADSGGISGELSYGHWLDGAASEEQPGINWVIVGGESGHGSRPFDVDWARSIVKDCNDASVPVFVKQLGAKPIGTPRSLALADRKGGDWDSPAWPPDLRVREFPEVEA